MYKLFQYAVFFVPTPKELEKGEKPKVLVDIKSVVAKSENDVRTIASREIPEEYLDKLEQVNIVVRPF